jgi:N6-adenosine-specific RNA methylase IME4
MADWETLVNEGIEARKLGDQSAWRLGDLAGDVQTSYGEGDLEKYAARVGVVAKTLYDYKRVAARFSERSENLTWGHHQVVAAQQGAEAWLSRAELEGWTVEQLRQAIQPQPGEAGPLPAGTYQVLYADPPWAYDNSGFETSAAQHYRTLTPDEIAELKDDDGRGVATIAADSAVLFMWVTNPHLEDMFVVFRGWGFVYKTNFVWVKTQQVAGFYNYGAHELLCVATKGSCLPIEGSLVRSVIEAKRREHSRKPDEVYALIEAMYDGPYVELFARNERTGWASWGDEIDS